MLGILIGIASVILLTSIGEGTRRYVIGQFTQFGTNLIAINPGKVVCVSFYWYVNPEIFAYLNENPLFEMRENVRQEQKQSNP
jgi:ABC-type antimicrobial peptide transport system permease subunit